MLAQGSAAAGARLPPGFRVGHWTDLQGWTGATVVLAPPDAVGSGEVRGGGPGTRETDLLSVAAHQPGPQAVCLTGGSAFGLAAADGVMRHLRQGGAGYPTPVGPVPLVSSAVIFDLMLGDAEAHPDAEAGFTACEVAGESVERGSVGAGTGATVGKVLGPNGWTKGGLGYAAIAVGQALIGALAVVNAFGEVLAEDGSVLAGAWSDGGYLRTGDALRAGRRPDRPGMATTLVCLMTDAQLSKTEAWLVARAASAGVARAVDPSATALDGDVAFCLAAGTTRAEPLALAASAAHATAAAIRDAVRCAHGAPRCPAAAERTRP
jgi:L-aminopeptidase/D-esterase-like protein